MGGRSRRSTLQAWGYYLLALTAWVTIVLVVSVLGFIICRSLIWYETNPLYHLLNWVRDYYFFVFAFVILVGWVVISYYFIARPNQQLQALVEASGQLSQPTEEPIRLPPAMKSVEDQLNLAREEALRAQAEGADYLGVGAMFPTGTKTNTIPTSADTLKAICAAVSIPVVAIGGVTAQNLPTLAGTGIAGAAVVSAIFSQSDLTAAARTLRAAADLAAR